MRYNRDHKIAAIPIAKTEYSSEYGLVKCISSLIMMMIMVMIMKIIMLFEMKFTHNGKCPRAKRELETINAAGSPRAQLLILKMTYINIIAMLVFNRIKAKYLVPPERKLLQQYQHPVTITELFPKR